MSKCSKYSCSEFKFWLKLVSFRTNDDNNDPALDQQDSTKEPNVEGTFCQLVEFLNLCHYHLENDNNIELELGSSEEGSEFLTTQSSVDSSDDLDAYVSEGWNTHD